MKHSGESKSVKDYRLDIDGLRAVAVLSVIIFHINEHFMPGGFVGVDIFFVISGFLISQHIFRDLNRSAFSILEFYKRRVKRIAPAMLVVVFVTFVVAQAILRPLDAEKVAESGLWSLMSLANVYFWLYQDTSYFAAASNESPLLHLWSLGVEEQFYIIWPIILLCTFRVGHGKVFFGIIGVITAASFALGEYLYLDAPSFTYYMLPSRAGELLIGALLAQWIIKKGHIELPSGVVSLASFVGVGLVTGSLFLLSEESVFPGFSAIAPTLGTALLIFAGHYGQSLPTRLLTTKPMVFVGLISYSAYLWHWPILAFYRYGHAEIAFIPGLIMFVLTIVLATLSYQFIEKPTRKSQRSAFQIIVRQFVVPTGVIAFLCLTAMKLDGYGLRYFSEEFTNDLQSLRDEVRPAYKYDYVCQVQLITEDVINNPECIIGPASSSTPAAILWGDSNAAHYIGILGEFANAEGFNFRNLEVGSCPPLNVDALPYASNKRLSDCNSSRELAWRSVMEHKIVMISSNWTYYQSKSEDFLSTFFNTVEALLKEDKTIILIGKAPIFPNYDRLCREKVLSYPLELECRIPSAALDTSVIEVNKRLEEFASQTAKVEYIDFNNTLCPKGQCSIEDENSKIMYYDSSHLSLPASWRLGQDIINAGGVPFPFTMIKQASH